MKTLMVVVCLLTYAATASAQGAIAGSVSDPSGALLSGVLVEASSSALIERARTTVTDGAGSYRIEDLRPGIYSIRFMLDGWRAYERESVPLAGPATVMVNAQLELGPIAEAVIVSGDSPTVDVRSAINVLTLDADVTRALPTVRSYNALVGLVPGVVTSTNDVVTGTATVSFPVHGGRANEGRLMIDGITVGGAPSGNSPTSYTLDVGHFQEVTFSSADGLGAVETAGLVMNLVPRAGGNTTRGSTSFSVSGAGLRDDNTTHILSAQDVVASTPLRNVYDVAASIGGPIARNRIWYFADAHTGANTRDSGNVFYNLNAGDPSAWLYAPDPSRRAYSDRTFENASLRLTWQAAPRHKIGVFWDEQALCRTCNGATPGLMEPQRISPEAVGVLGRPLRVTHATWSSPWSNRLLFEAGFGGTYFGVGNFEREPNPTRDLIRVVEQCASGCAENGGIPGLAYRSQDYSVAYTGSYEWKGTLSYVTGTHSLKIGYQHVFMTDDRTWYTNTENLTYRVNGGVPNQLTQSISPWVNNARAAWDAVFIQERWTRDRLTLQGALRFDRARSWFPAQQEGPSRFLQTPIVVPETSGVDSYKDISPRFGAAYDLGGRGRTALKVSAGRYLESAGVTGTYANTNPTLRMPQTTMTFGTAGITRSWIDANQNFAPDCDLLNPSTQDLRPQGGDMCGVMSNTSFGRNVLTNNFDPALLDGWGVRPSDWNLGLSIEHQLFRRAALAVSYNQRWFRGFSVVENRALAQGDLTPFAITAPLDPRLPRGGGYVVDGLYDVVPEKSGQVDNLVRDASAYGAWRQYYRGLDVTLSVRAGRTLTLAGGTSTGQTVADNCDVRAHLPELATTTTGTSTFGGGLLSSAVTPTSPYCRVAFGVLTQLRGLVSYEVPRVGLQLSGTIQSKPGAMLAANYAVPNADVVPSLGRNLSGNAPNVTVNLIAPGTMYGDRINELDLRVGKILTFGHVRATLAVELYNAINSSAVLAYNNAFVPNGTWLQPMTILTPRFAKLAAELEF
jgi:hypothetical protein